jgi:hypothetical protein
VKVRGSNGGIGLVPLVRASSSPPRWRHCLPLLGAMVGCGDPAIDQPVLALGPEDPTVAPGPLHRPGQPCVLCHSQAGGESVFSLAGTVYVDATSLKPIDDVRVLIVDARSRRFVATTNCAGNFLVRDTDFVPDFPVWLGLQRGETVRDMDTPVYREGSCAGCHVDPKSPSSAGHVFLIEATEAPPASNCR